jgi:hypothetical protein
MVMPDTDVRWYRGRGERWNTVIAAIVLTVLLDGVLIAGGITTPGARALSLTGAVLVCCAGCAVVVLWLRAGIGVTTDRLIVRDALGTQHLIPWPSVAGFDLDKWRGAGGGRGGLTLVVICDDGRRLHTLGCSVSGTGEQSWAAARRVVRALESERQARAPQSAGP